MTEIDESEFEFLALIEPRFVMMYRAFKNFGPAPKFGDF